MSFSHLHPRIQSQRNNYGNFLSEERDRRFIQNGYELFISEDGLFAELYRIQGGEIVDTIARTLFDDGKYTQRFHVSEKPIYFRTINKSNFWFEHFSDYVIFLFFTDSYRRVTRIPLYKKQLVNVVFDNALLKINSF